MVREGLSLRGLLTKWMKEEGNVLLVGIVKAKVTTLELAHPGNIILLLLLLLLL